MTRNSNVQSQMSCCYRLTMRYLQIFVFLASKDIFKKPTYDCLSPVGHVKSRLLGKTVALHMLMCLKMFWEKDQI